MVQEQHIQKVSVVMCTHNGEHFVREQLISILQQTYPLSELLIFDDNSSDNTVPIIQQTIGGLPFARLVVNSQNIGFRKNFEQAFVAASGDVIAISDQDDVWLPEKLEKMIAAWNDESPAIYCNSVLFEGEVPTEIKPDWRMRRYAGTDARKIFFRNTVSGHALIIRRSFLHLVLPVPDTVMYDWWIAVVASYNGGLQYLPEVLVLHRYHAANVSVDLTERSIAEDSVRHKIAAIAHCQAFAKAPGISPSHSRLAAHFAGLMQASLHKKFYRPLFHFAVIHRHLIFHYKRKKMFSLFSLLKHSYRIALGKG